MRAMLLGISILALSLGGCLDMPPRPGGPSPPFDSGVEGVDAPHGGDGGFTGLAPELVPELAPELGVLAGGGRALDRAEPGALVDPRGIAPRLGDDHQLLDRRQHLARGRGE